MPTCRECDAEFPNKVLINGEVKSVQNRRFCLNCSPYGSHNTSALTPFKFVCKCGEVRPSAFYVYKPKICKQCIIDRDLRKQKDTKQKARDYLGGKCSNCKYSRYQVSLDIHHTDPSKKDPNFKHMRGWSWSRVIKELETCILLCKNCHSAHHAGLVKI